MKSIFEKRDSLIANRDRLHAQYDEAQAELETARQALQAETLAGFVADSQHAEVMRLALKVETLAGALGQTQRDLQDLETLVNSQDFRQALERVKRFEGSFQREQVALWKDVTRISNKIDQLEREQSEINGLAFQFGIPAKSIMQTVMMRALTNRMKYLRQDAQFFDEIASLATRGGNA